MRALNKRLVPVAIVQVPPEELPEAIGRIHLLPAEGTFDLARHLHDLVATLNSDRGWIKEHTRLGDRAAQWLARGRPGALLLRGSALKDAELWRASQPRSAPAPGDDILDLMLASRQAATRRQQWWITGSLVGLVFALGLAAFAELQRREAEASYGAAKTAVDRLIVELARGMQTVEKMPIGTINASLDVVKRLVADLQRVRGVDDGLEASRAAMFYQFAKTFQKAEDRKAALQASDESLAIRRRLIETGKTSPDWRWDLIESLHLAGDLQRELDSLSDARRFYEEAVSHNSALVGSYPRDQRYAIGMSKSLVRVGDLDATENRNADAKRRYEDAFKIVSAIVGEAQQVPNDDILRELSWTYSKVGDINVKLLNFAEALGSYEKALCVRQMMLARQPQNTLLRADVSFTFEKIGNAMLGSGDFEAAANAFMEAVRIRRGLYESDKGQLRWLRDLASAMHLFAVAKRRGGDLKTARAFFLAAAMSRRDLMLRQPQDKRAARAFDESMAAAAEALSALPPDARERTEAIWTAVVGYEIEQATAKAIRTASDPKTCFEDIVAELGKARVDAKSAGR